MKAVFIAWQDPESRRWVPVGRLTAKGTVFQFVYTQGAMSFPNFRAFGAMSDLHSSYESSTLFPLFSNRLLSKNRPEYHDYLRWLDVKTEISDPLDELAKTGGIRATDSLIVFPCPEPQEDGRYSIREGLINSRFHSELCFWGSRQDEFGGQPLFRAPVGGAPPLSDGRLPASGHMYPTFPPRAAVVPRTDSPSHS